MCVVLRPSCLQDDLRGTHSHRKRCHAFCCTGKEVTGMWVSCPDSSRGDAGYQGVCPSKLWQYLQPCFGFPLPMERAPNVLQDISLPWNSEEPLCLCCTHKGELLYLCRPLLPWSCLLSLNVLQRVKLCSNLTVINRQKHKLDR